MSYNFWKSKQKKKKQTFGEKKQFLFDAVHGNFRINDIFSHCEKGFIGYL